IYNAKEGLRLQRVDGKWLRETTVGRGQWGITQDDSGRLFYCPNTSLIRGDLLPCYFPNQNATPSLANVPLYKEQQVFPIRVTPGVNRGYLPDILRPVVTPLLKQQILDRRLEAPRGMGRSWRIAHDTTQNKPAPDLGKRSPRELVSYLASANGWHRDMAQQLLVQRRDPSVVADLEK